jgi:hypothetical protein
VYKGLSRGVTKLWKVALARRAKTLAGLSVVQLDAVMRHPEQLGNLTVVAGLLQMLDAAKGDFGRWCAIQEQLYRASYRVQQAGHDLRRALGRLDDGKAPGWPVAHDSETKAFIAPEWRLNCNPDGRDRTAWDAELRVAERVDRQLKAVGDVLAWQVFRYDRRIIIALSQNNPSGPFVGKDGLAAERGTVTELWARHGHFALMHDLTSVLRIVDITEVQTSGFRMLHEIKSNPKASVSRQIRTAEAALASVDGRDPLPARGPVAQPFLWRSSVQLRTHVRELRSLIDQADAHGFSVGRMADRVVGVVNLLVAAQNGRSPSEQWAEYEEHHERALDKHLLPSLHRMKGISADGAGRVAAIAPYGIYPLDPWQRAAIICDYVIVEGTMADRALISALEKRGLEARSLLPAANGARSAHDEIMEVIRGDRRMVLHGAAINQLLLEWVHTNRYADAVNELFRTPDPRPQGVLTFSNERGAWI